MPTDEEPQQTKEEDLYPIFFHCLYEGAHEPLVLQEEVLDPATGTVMYVVDRSIVRMAQGPSWTRNLKAVIRGCRVRQPAEGAGAHGGEPVPGRLPEGR